MYLYRPYRCQVCGTEKEILSEDEALCLEFCSGCSTTPDRDPEHSFELAAFGNTRTLRPFECIEEWIDLDVDVHDDVIEHSPLFEGMSAWQVKRVIMLGEVRTFQPGETIVSQGHTDQFTYVMLTGNALVVIANPNGEKVIAATIGPGEVFGEVASILGMTRTASVIAETPAEVFALDAGAVERIGRFYPRIAYHVTQNSAKVLGVRFRGVNAELAEWKRPGDADRPN